MEVLISMAILFVGLLCVAALIPAGRFEILQGAKVDHATMVGRAAFRDLKIRGYLNPGNWYDASNNPVYKGPDASHTTNWFSAANTNSNGVAVTPALAIDPLGLTAATTYGPTFPFGATPLYLSRIYPLQAMANSAPLADPVFRNADDLLFTANTAGRDLPPAQQMFNDSSNNPVKRGSEGNYSWLATIVTDPTSSALAAKATVSVAVFYKRDLSIAGAGERIATIANGAAGFPGSGISGGEVKLDYGTPAAAKPIKPGAWIMLAGRLPAGGINYDYFRWYRVVAADTTNGIIQFVTLAGADWNPNTTNTQAWLFDSVIAVYEKNMRLEIP